MGRTMVKVQITPGWPEYIDFQTISLEHGHSPHFLLSMEDFEALHRGEYLVVRSAQHRREGRQPNATLNRELYKRELHICFIWPNEQDVVNEYGEVEHYWAEEIRLPYDDLFAFVRERSWAGAPTVWKCLSIKECPAPHIVFMDKKNLRMCLANKLIRKALVRHLRDYFDYPGVEQVNFYDRVVPYSFTYQEICDTPIRTVGSVTFFQASERGKAMFRYTPCKEANPRNPYSDMKWASEWR